MRIGQNVVILSRDALRATAGTIVTVNTGPLTSYGVRIAGGPYDAGRDRIVEIPAAQVWPLTGSAA